MNSQQQRESARLGRLDKPQTARRKTKREVALSTDGVRAARSESNSKVVDASFDPNAPELQLTWSSFAKSIFCVNTYPNGITFASHDNEVNEEIEGEEQIPQDIKSKYLPNQFHLRFRDTRDYQLAAGKYFLYRENYDQALEKHLSHLHQRGTLKSSVFYLGTVADPFMSLQKKFEVTMTCLELLEHYRPGFVVVQTRSPMAISALPYLKIFGDGLVVSMPIESRLESAIARYTPGQPKIAERLIAADGLRIQGIRVNLVASPILPYGEFYRDAWDYAELLDNHADYISVGCLASGDAADEAQLKTLPVAHKLVTDNAYRWLRPHSYRNLFYALKTIAPEKLLLPVEAPKKPSQLDLFAA